MRVSIKTAARSAGVLYLINIIFGFFAIGYVPQMIITKDPITTAQNILSHESIYRLALAAHLVILLTNIPLGVIFFRLFRPINKGLSMAIILFTMVGTAIESTNLLNQFMAMFILKGQSLAAGFDQQQLISLSYLFTRLQTTGVNIAFVFFGFYGICAGYLIIRSGFFPKIIGAFMALGGACYIIYSFVNFLSPAFAIRLVPWMQIPSGLSELAFCLWLLIVGVHVKKWEAWKSLPE